MTPPTTRGLRFASVCSGIEAASVAWHPLGWEAAWLSEIEPFPCAVLAHHYPTTPNLGNMTKISEADLERNGHVDLLVGGTPCQSFSVAGLRKGMADPRGGLALVFLELARRTRARWVVWENVPGVLSADGGRAFGSFLGGLAELGYGWSYRVLDAQYFGLAQRRKRVFVVGYLGDWRRAAAVLLERAGLRGDPAPSREAGAGTTPRAWDGAAGGGWPAEVAPTLGVSWANRSPGNMQEIHAQKGGLFVPDVVGARGNRGDDAERGTIFVQPVSDPISAVEQRRWTAEGCTFRTVNLSAVRTGVRRLTPVECERLQGFPDGYTDVPYRGKPASDGPRYKALGNSMATNVMRWIGDRIAAVEARR